MGTKIPTRFWKLNFGHDSIRIPMKFLERFILPDTVFLKVPDSSRSWKVDLVRNDDGEIWMQNGWKEFKDHYSIDFGHCLVFDYDREHSHFEVAIYDMSSAEIDYPVEQIESESDDSVVFLRREMSESQKGKEILVEHISTVQMTGRKRPKTGELHGNPVRKSARNLKLGGKSTVQMTGRKRPKTGELHGNPVRKSARNLKFGGQHHIENTVGQNSLNEGGGRAGIGMSTRGFTKKLELYNVHKLLLRKAFSEENGLMAEREVMLQNADGEIKGQARVQVDLARGICNLVGGWKKFLIDNKVTVGSTMSFNFVSSSDNIIEFQYVDMVRDKDKLFEYVKCTRQGYELTAPCETKDHARREPENIPLNTESDVDHAGKTWNFSKEMKKYNAHRLVFPQDFARGTGIATSTELILKDGKGSQRRVTVIRTKAKHLLIMSKGWNDFVKGNKVFEGDTVSFKFIPNSGNVIEARVVNTGRKRKPLFSKKGRGRPRSS